MQEATMTQSDYKETLYARIGGYEGLRKLLTHFYADVRQHAVIGPIFQARIQDWPAHIEKIAGFWSGLTGGPALYGGGLMAKHMPLGLAEEHFGHWLTLWAFHCDRQLKSKDADMLKALAHQIGGRLKHHIVN
ncbi:MAG: truncated hemoglobin [Verrucomicrobiota bacterium]|jgi:hemoglobin